MNDKIVKIYTCDACRYTFGCNIRPVFCPDCGKPQVRPSTGKEIKEYYIIQKEIAAEDKAANQ